MSQCVPSWDVDENPPPPRVSLRSNSNSTGPDVSMLDYDVAELTWENGQLAMHGLGLPRVPVKPSTTLTSTSTKDAWEKPRASGTLEAIVNQATTLPHSGKSLFFGGGGGGGGDGCAVGGVYGNVLVPWLDPHRAAAIAAAAATSNGIAMDALVPNSNRTEEQNTAPSGYVGCSTLVGSCSAAPQDEGGHFAATAAKRARVATHVQGIGRDQSMSMSGSATFGRHSQQVTLDTSEKEFGVDGFTSTSIGSMENTKTTTVDDHDSVCHSRPMVSLCL